MICQLRGRGIDFFSWVFNLDSALRQQEVPSGLCLVDSRQDGNDGVGNKDDGGYVIGFYLEESVWF